MKIFYLVASIIIMITALMLPLAGQTWDEYRDHEVMVFTGNSMSKFETAPIGHIFVLAYHEKDNSWHELTLQIDELDDQGYFGTNYNNIVDLTDEFAFMVCEAGDYAPSSSWIDDEDSRQYGRLQFELINPDDPLHKKYVYVYRSSTFAHNPELPHYYIKYVAATSGASDTVKAMTYLEGHNGKGIPDVWKIADSTGAYGIDILDRQKARVKGKYRSLLSYDMKEDNLKAAKYEYKRGPIRIIRYVSYTATIFSSEVSLGTFKYFYYPYRIVALGADKSLSSDYGVSLIRQSFDLKKSAIGMLFHNPYNFNVSIDGIQDSVITNIQPSPVMNWYMCSGAPGTFVMLNEFTPPSSKTNKLYYQESFNGETADKTSDTGDDSSFCDVGIMFTGEKMKGQVSLPYFAYFLPGNRNRDVGAALAYQTQNPIYQDITYNLYSPPTQVVLTLPDTSGPAQYPISIPVLISDVSGLNILSHELAIQFDSRILQVNGISVVNTLAENWDSTSVRISNDTIFVAMQGATALQQSGVLFYLNFFVTGLEGQQSPLHFVRAKFNIWNPLALTTDGNFSALAAPEVPVSIADTTLRSGEPLHIPVTISSTMGLELKSYSMDLSFNHAILQFDAVDTTATVASGWEKPVVQYNPGILSVTATGSTPLRRAGALIYLNFKVIGPDASSTIIHFSNMTFNSGQYLADTKDGTVNVRGVVPVELSSFSAIILDRDVKLQWTTATESNNFGFFVQRIADKNTDWRTIGFVQGKGTTASLQAYSFIDSKASSGNWYYRLQQQDLDGQIHYSQTIEVNLLPTKFALYQNYPNPFNPSTLIKYELPIGEHRVKVVIYDLLGHRIQTLVDEENQHAGAYQISWDGRDDAGQKVASGVYFYRLQSGNQIFIKKMVLIE